MRLWDGFTDPLIGFLIDKTESKLGKFRPFMILGNVILASTTIILFKTTHLVPEKLRLLYFIFIYAIYIIGYTFQTAVTKAGQTVLTNDPKQRPVFTLLDSFYNLFAFGGGQIFVASFLVKKHNGFTMSFFNEFILYFISISAIFTALAVLGIWTKDRKENFGIGNGAQLRMKDYWPVIKNNKAIQMLIVAASTDKLSGTIMRNSVVGVMLFGILIGNYDLSGTIVVFAVLPTVIITIIGVRVAALAGQNKALVISTWACLINYSLFFIFLNIADLTTISLSGINAATIMFFLLYVLGAGFASVAGNIVIPMIADCSDYETYKTGKYVPGMMGTVFSFVDKPISSFSITIIGFTLAAVGYKEQFPQLHDTATPVIFWTTMFLFIGMPILGWIASLVAMKFYPLDKEKMIEIQATLEEKRDEIQQVTTYQG